MARSQQQQHSHGILRKLKNAARCTNLLASLIRYPSPESSTAYIATKQKKSSDRERLLIVSRHDGCRRLEEGEAESDERNNIRSDHKKAKGRKTKKEKVPKGFLPVLVYTNGLQRLGGGAAAAGDGDIYGRVDDAAGIVVLEAEEYVIPSCVLGHPLFSSVLQSSAREFGYSHPGALRLAIDSASFLHLLSTLPPLSSSSLPTSYFPAPS